VFDVPVDLFRGTGELPSKDHVLAAVARATARMEARRVGAEDR
jgi:hypothetical protein